ncbi:hypothetical protein CHUAL_012201 [Chamberlinius hualienensis]
MKLIIFLLCATSFWMVQSNPNLRKRMSEPDEQVEDWPITAYPPRGPLTRKYGPKGMQPKIEESGPEGPNEFFSFKPLAPSVDLDKEFRELLVKDGTKIQQKLINGKLQSIRCRCNLQNAYDKIEGESFNRSQLVTKGIKCRREVATNLTHGSMMVYFNVDFGSKSAKAIQLQMSTKLPPSQKLSPEVKVHIDFPNGKPLANFHTQTTGDDCKFINHVVPLEYPVSGVHNVYFTITTDARKNWIQAMDLDWFKFLTSMSLPMCTN